MSEQTQPLPHTPADDAATRYASEAAEDGGWDKFTGEDPQQDIAFEAHNEIRDQDDAAHYAEMDKLDQEEQDRRESEQMARDIEEDMRQAKELPVHGPYVPTENPYEQEDQQMKAIMADTFPGQPTGVKAEIVDAIDEKVINTGYDIENGDYSQLAGPAKKALNLKDEAESDAEQAEWDAARDAEEREFQDDQYEDEEDNEDPLAGDVDRNVPESETRSDAQINHDESVASRLHMSGADGADEYWKDHDRYVGGNTQTPSAK